MRRSKEEMSQIGDRIKNILKSEGLCEWEIRWNTGGGLCRYETKEIWLGKENDNAMALALHEIAHALCPKEKCGKCWVNLNKQAECFRSHNNGHNAIWGDCFTRLVKKYMY